jgi:purine-nucleoside/S-methyl-5'-thioadenosine phosphorylase / adenosine deaminase
MTIPGIAPTPSGPLWLEITGFPGTTGWRAGFTTLRAGGSLEEILPMLGWRGLPVFRLAQRHGNRVIVIGPQDDPSLPAGEADGLATRRRGAVLAIASADCVPIVLFDPRRGAGAVLHAGWRGTRSRIAREGVTALAQNFGSRPEDLRAMLAPAIGSGCYCVGADLLNDFRSTGHNLEGLILKTGEGMTLDLVEANRRQLEEAGMAAGQIQSVGLCTHCLPQLFPSYRRDGPGTGRILTFLGSEPES